MDQEATKLMKEALLAVFPIVLAVILLHVFLVRLPVDLFLRFAIGSFLITIGLLFFLLGVKVGVLPFGELVGSDLPQRGSVLLLICATFMLSLVATLAEPGVQVLAAQVDTASDGKINRLILTLATAGGLGLFVVLAMARILLNVPIVYLFSGGYLIVMILAFFTPSGFVPIAFDAGGVTTGPMTVPFILSLGFGTASVLRGRSTLTDGFGLVGLASIGPIISVMILGIIYN